MGGERNEEIINNAYTWFNVWADQVGNKVI